VRLTGRGEEEDFGNSSFQLCVLSGSKLLLQTSSLFTWVGIVCVGRAATASISFGK